MNFEIPMLPDTSFPPVLVIPHMGIELRGKWVGDSPEFSFAFDASLHDAQLRIKVIHLAELGITHTTPPKVKKDQTYNFKLDLIWRNE